MKFDFFLKSTIVQAVMCDIQHFGVFIVFLSFSAALFLITLTAFLFKKSPQYSNKFKVLTEQRSIISYFLILQ